MYAQERPKKSKLPLVLGGGCASLVGLCCLSGIGLAILGKTQTDRVADAAEVCDHGIVQGAAPVIEGQANPIVAFSQGVSGWIYAGSEMPVEWERAADSVDARLVLCLGEEEDQVIEDCAYGQSEFEIHRYRRARPARLVEASSGRTLQSARLLGSEPSECPELASASYALRGSAVGSAEIAAAFAPLVTTGRAPEQLPPLVGLTEPWTSLGPALSGGRLRTMEPENLSVEFDDGMEATVRARVEAWLTAEGWTLVPHSLVDGNARTAATLAELGLDDAAELARGSYAWGGSWRRGEDIRGFLLMHTPGNPLELSVTLIE
ncbi:MAG: hypothetical protein H6719_13735 [Sandaracinaceae bacterium]|nr:hypothetical protein [Sandaracinaceae bacterium]